MEALFFGFSFSILYEPNWYRPNTRREARGILLVLIKKDNILAGNYKTNNIFF
ncbi:hypothetical protein HanIR_Chr15g0749231 [Helianthus annuus]|nr:hypothetical protein HanIR_Chr15g0749231 [Helianthus annuus]